jgi:hypothetical protein
MSNEQQELLEEAYNNFVTTVENNRPEGYTREVLTQEEFVKNSIIDPYFSETWGLKIEERELDMFERWELANLTPNMSEIDYCNKLCDEHNVPTKLITLTYNNEKIESYE